MLYRDRQQPYDHSALSGVLREKLAVFQTSPPARWFFDSEFRTAYGEIYGTAALEKFDRERHVCENVEPVWIAGTNGKINVDYFACDEIPEKLAAGIPSPGEPAYATEIKTMLRDIKAALGALLARPS
jgi:hypothetical protein